MYKILLNFCLNILGLFRRALCILKRRKRSNSNSEPLELINVVSDHNYSNNKAVIKDWNSWDDSPKTVEEFIEVYREKLVKKPEPEEQNEPQNDLFSDMEPKIIKQKKVFLKSQQDADNDKLNFSRLEAKTTPYIPIQNELEDWEDDLDLQKAGWDEIDDKNTKLLIREKRRELRNQKQESKPKQNSFPIAEKISFR